MKRTHSINIECLDDASLSAAVTIVYGQLKISKTSSTLFSRIIRLYKRGQKTIQQMHKHTLLKWTTRRRDYCAACAQSAGRESTAS